MCGSRGRVPTRQVQDPEFKLPHTQKKILRMQKEGRIDEQFQRMTHESTQQKYKE
jgi:hypothetical protein